MISADFQIVRGLFTTGISPIEMAQPQARCEFLYFVKYIGNIETADLREQADTKKP